ncbi:MAG: ABC transporter permease subunit [Planctomycetes bacterium]|nr:ABC transporter permease subunit [Planctomycetota bacterium]
MNPCWAVARQTVAESLRMRIAWVFLVLIGLIVFVLPFSITGDSSLTGAVQSFMSYAFSATSVLLGVLTLFMSRSVSDELTHHQVFLVMTKPIPRWQYIAGKWLGIVMLNSVFLAGSGLTIYGMVHYIKRTHPPLNQALDLKALHSEVLVARHAVKTKVPSFDVEADAEYERNIEEGVYDDRLDFRPAVEKRRLLKKRESMWRVVGPQNARLFEFENVLLDRTRQQSVYLRFKAEVSNYPPDEIFRSVWLCGNAFKNTPEYQINVRHVVGRYHTIPVPADAVAADNTLTVKFFNRNPYPGERQFRNVIHFRRSDEVELLFVVGSFEGNVLRLLTLMWCKLVFLAAVGVLMTTMFSFPVAALASFTVYALAGMSKFIM